MVETIGTDRPEGAAIADIEKELVKLWRQVGTSDKPMLRARVFTLVVVAPEADENERVECLAQLSARHPARNLLLLLGDPAAKEHLDADVTLLCHVRPHALCAEQIHLRARGSALEHLPAAVRALLTANLSVVLWWTLPPDPTDPLFQQLADLCDRVIVDSSTLEKVPELDQLSDEVKSRRLSDLNWSRLTHWREAIAQCFDSQLHRKYLPEISTITVETGKSVAAGWLLVGWLASRLDWRCLRVTDNKFRFKNQEGRIISIEFKVENGDDAITSVTLSGDNVRFEVKRMGDSSLQNTSAVPDAPILEQLTRLPDETEPAILSRALDRTTSDSAYIDAFAAVQTMLEKLE